MKPRKKGGNNVVQICQSLQSVHLYHVVPVYNIHIVYIIFVYLFDTTLAYARDTFSNIRCNAVQLSNCA